MSMSDFARSDARKSRSAGCGRFPVLGAAGGNVGVVGARAEQGTEHEHAALRHRPLRVPDRHSAAPVGQPGPSGDCLHPSARESGDDVDAIEKTTLRRHPGKVKDWRRAASYDAGAARPVGWQEQEARRRARRKRRSIARSIGNPSRRTAPTSHQNVRLRRAGARLHHPECAPPKMPHALATPA